ncbi:MAG: hypothetical protein FWG13_00290 [Leptospirales bacterium]|nr:hypothetical protein [Leptospirales bacterium]
MRILLKIICALSVLFWGVASLAQDGDVFDVFLSMDKRIYSDTEEVNLRVSVKNISNDTAVFYIYEDKNIDTPYTTFQPKVYDMIGKENENIIDYKRQSQYTVDVVDSMNKRAVQLGAREIFTYTIDLKRVYKMQTGFSYRVRCYFVPDMGVRYVIHGKNELTFHVSGLKENAGQPAPYSINRDISPSEIVVLALEAEKHSDMGKMLKYIDLEEFIKIEPNFMRSYSISGELERREILEKFRQYLLKPRRDYLIAFKVVEEGIDRETAFVDVLAERYSARVNDSYRYRFVLRKSRDFGTVWLITGLEASIFKGKIQ